jgi:hypothetical protein
VARKIKSFTGEEAQQWWRMQAILNPRGPVADSAEHATVLPESILSAGEEQEEWKAIKPCTRRSNLNGEKVRFGSEWDGRKSISTHKERNPSKKSKREGSFLLACTYQQQWAETKANPRTGVGGSVHSTTTGHRHWG